MAATPNLEPNHIQVSERTQLNAIGNGKKVTTLKYFLGEQGPFSVEFSAEEWTPDAGRAAMDRQAAILRALLGQ